MNLKAALLQLGACDAALEWVGDRTPEQAWQECPRGDWLLWVAARVKVERRLVVLAACACTRTALKYVPEGEDRPRKAIEAAEAWCQGECTIEELRRAANVADAYAQSVYYSAARAAYAAAQAAYVAANADNDDAVIYVYDAAYAAAHSASQADDAADDAAAKLADIVRSMIPLEVVMAAAGGGDTMTATKEDHQSILEWSDAKKELDNG